MGIRGLAMHPVGGGVSRGCFDSSKQAGQLELALMPDVFCAAAACLL
jgi:hypothetical protein